MGPDFFSILNLGFKFRFIDPPHYSITKTSSSSFFSICIKKTQFDVNHSLQFFRIKNQLDLSVASLKLASFGEHAHDFASSACDRAAVLPAALCVRQDAAAKVKDEMRHQGDNKPSFFSPRRGLIVFL